MSDFKHNSEENYIEIIQRLVKCVVILILLIIALVVVNIMDLRSPKQHTSLKSAETIAEKSLVIASDSSATDNKDTLSKKAEVAK